MFQRYAQFPRLQLTFFDTDHSVELPLLAVLLGTIIFSFKTFFSFRHCSFGFSVWQGREKHPFYYFEIN